jgi:hypothetical protein
MAQAQHTMTSQGQETELLPRQGKLRAPAAPVARPAAAAVGLAFIEALIGYEWLLSAFDKIHSATFRSGLARQLTQALQGNPNTWWVALVESLVLPRVPFFAVLVEVSEIGVAMGCFAGALLWASGRFPARRWARHLNVGVLAALAGSALMTANYYLMAGKTLPFLNPGDPFDEGLSLDGLLTFVALGLLVIHVAPVWRRRNQHGDGAKGS